MITLLQIKETGIAEDLGLCRDDVRFTSLLNIVTERLMYTGNWWGTIRRIKATVFNKRIVTPLNVAGIERVSIRGNVEKIRGEAFEFLEGGFGVAEDQCPKWMWACGTDVIDAGTSAISNQICQASRLSVTSTADECAGASVTIQGEDANGEFIRTENADGCWQDGVTLMLDGTADTDPPTSRKLFCDVSSIVKTNTNGVVTVATNDLAGGGYILAKLQPKDRTSAYRVYNIPRMACYDQCPCGSAPVVTALVKMAFVPVYNDNDILSISSIPAIKDALWSEFYAGKENGDQVSAARFAKAIAMLQAQLAHHRGAGQLNPIAVTDDGTFGASQIMPVYGGGYGG